MITGRYMTRNGVWPGVFSPNSKGGLALNETTLYVAALLQASDVVLLRCGASNIFLLTLIPYRAHEPITARHCYVMLDMIHLWQENGILV